MSPPASKTRGFVPAVLGFRVKSGWASAVLLAGSRGRPALLYRGRIELSDPRVPQSAQPYHATFGTLQKNSRVLRRLKHLVHRCTDRSLAGLLRECRARGYVPRGVALVVGSTIEPESIGNEHVRAHAYESQLFRTALARAAHRRHLGCRVIRERDLALIATMELHKTRGEIAQVAKSAGRAVGKPWRTDHKAAFTAAWIMLVAPQSAAA